MGAKKLATLIISFFAAATLCFGAADGPDELAQALALEKQMEKIIAEAEPSIACILVSRNEGVRKYLPQPLEKDPPALNESWESYKRAGKLVRPEQVPDLALRKKVNLADAAIVPESFGSGIVVDADKGLILTNFHVVRDALVVYVRLPGGKGSFADIYAADFRSDLAVLKVNQSVTKNIRPIRHGDAGKMRRGQFVLSLANPYAAGFRDGQPSASWGILSNIRRRATKEFKEQDRVKSLHHYGTLLQMDARLNLGCSGGALLNLQGELIGLTTSLAAIHGGETPGGFAVPIDACFTRILNLLKAGEEIEYGFLGVSWRLADEDDRNPGKSGDTNGVLVKNVVKGSPAFGKINSPDNRVMKGDRICEVGGVKINDIDDLFLNLGTQLAGSRVRIVVERGNKEVPIVVTLAKMYAPTLPGARTRIFSECKMRPFDRNGLRVEYSSTLLRGPDEASVQDMPVGVLVDEVRPGSEADKAMPKLRPGQLITHVGVHEVVNPAAYLDAVSGAGPFVLTVTDPESDSKWKVTLP